MKYTVSVENECFDIEIGRDGRVWVNRRPYNVDLQDIDGASHYSLLVDNRSYEAHIECVDGGECLMMVGGRPYRARLEGNGYRRNGNGKRSGDSCGRQCALQAEVRAPLPGLLVEMRVADGERVDEKNVVAVLESMKMNLELRAPRSGFVCGLHANPGHEVSQDQLLVVIAPDNGHVAD